MHPRADVPRIEAYVESTAQAIAAVAVGASRIELCGPGEGGLTPTAGELHAALGALAVLVHVMIRPRPGDFVYDARELEQMRAAIAYAKGAGATGVVFGVLTSSGEIDTQAMSELAALARPLRTVCHRAFDATPNADRALDDLVAIGIDGVLTSGHATTALAGSATIARHVARAPSTFEVIAGGGVRANHVRELIERTGVRSLHARGTDAAIIAALATAATSP